MGDLPGERFYGITLLAVPIGLALALMKHSAEPGQIEPVGAPAVSEGKPKAKGASA
jgi:hypothetical protein